MPVVGKIIHIVGLIATCIFSLICLGTCLGYSYDYGTGSTNNKKMDSEKKATFAFCILACIAYVVSIVGTYIP